ncbi:MAG: ComEC/Rec2 family competence protein [Gemmatimonadales bacterium]
MARPPWLVLVSLVAAIPSEGAAQFSSVRIQVVDVGQGDGILIRTPSEHWVLIDAGPNRTLADSLAPQFGVDRLGLVIVSHRHADHYSAIERILRQFPVDHVVGNLADCPTRSTDNGIRLALQERQIPAQSLGADTLDVDSVRFIILPPDPTDDACPDEENNNSVLVRLEYGQFSMLFTGDAEHDERNWLVANHPALLGADVLKASHHGGDNGTSATWLTSVAPDHVVISAGVTATYRHPMAAAVAAYEAATGGRVHCTNRHQTVTIYGYRDGRTMVRRRLANNKSCTYDGTHYLRP